MLEIYVYIYIYYNYMYKLNPGLVKTLTDFNFLIVNGLMI